jgi:hypothetical protein
LAENTSIEPWLRGTLTELHAVQRAVVHGLELAKEDLERWCGELTDEELNTGPSGIAPPAFHLRHISRSVDRLLTYAEGHPLSPQQVAALHTESEPQATRSALFSELTAALERAVARICAFSPNQLHEARTVGKKKLPTTVAGLLIHVGDHTQRHVGQALTTSKIIVAQRG